MEDQVQNIFAKKFEEKRAAYQSKLIRLFEQVQEENRAVNELMDDANSFLKEEVKKGVNYLDQQSIKGDVFTGIDTIIAPQKQQFVRKRATDQNDLARRLSNRMFVIQENSFDQSVSRIEQLNDIGRFTSVTRVSQIGGAASMQDFEMIETLPVGKIMTFIHDF